VLYNSVIIFLTKYIMIMVMMEMMINHQYHQ
jgi:hypothetical protein